MKTKTTFYLAGPMRGIAQFNFPAFDRAAADLRGRGYQVISPAEMDRAAGFDPAHHTLSDLDFNAAVRRDVEGIIRADAVVLLPGWEKSKGATGERGVAEWMGKPSLFYPELTEYQPSRDSGLPGEKLSNPKDIAGSDKLPLHLWPETATAVGSLGFLEGVCKYGRLNWREVGVRASIYVAAAKRHLNAWFEGEEVSADSGVPHLGSVLACIGILVDAQAAGKLNDDRNYAPTNGYRKLVEELTPMVPEIKRRFADRNPKHYTIADMLLSRLRL